MFKSLITILSITAILSGCDSKEAPKAQVEEPLFYAQLRRIISSNPNAADRAEATWELIHPKEADKNDPAAKSAFISRYRKSVETNPGFGSLYCDKPSHILKSPPSYDGDYAHVEDDVMCGKTLMATYLFTLVKYEGNWYKIRQEAKATYIDTKAGKLIADQQK